MQKVEIKNGKVIYTDLSPEEEAIHLAEASEREAEEKANQETALKARLLKELIELREMQANPELFTDKDKTDKQAAVDEIAGKLTAKP